MTGHNAIFRKTFMAVFALTPVYMFVACSPTASTSDDPSGGVPITAAVTVAASSSTLGFGETSTVTATVVGTDGNSVADGTTITFTLGDSTLGALDSSSATTTGGVASVTFTASMSAGAETVTAASPDATGAVNITISVLAGTGAASVAVSASPTTMTLGGTSTVTATCLDGNGDNVVNGTTVTFSVNDSSLGSIVPTSTTTTNGSAGMTLTALTTPGTATVTAICGTANGTVDIVVTGAASVTVSANPATITIGGTSSVTATVLDINGAAIPDGIMITWSLSDSNLGTITTSSTVAGGVASATFTAASNPGVITVTATVQGISNTAGITIIAPDAGSIEFLSASPQSIGLRGSGQVETAVVKFRVLDISGNSVLDGTSVDFCLLNGPSGGRMPNSGGEYINEADSVIESYTDDPTTGMAGCYDTGEEDAGYDTNSNGIFDSPMHAAVATVSGVATVNLHSGTVAGPVTIFATVVGGGISSASPTVSIGGGLPNMAHFTVISDIQNLPGLEFAGKTATISVYLADRFGNGNVLQGTTVSYYAESSATVSSSTTLDAQGATSVVFRTQAPVPNDVAAKGAGLACDVAVTQWLSSVNRWEKCLQDYVLTYYGITTANSPRDGWGTITVSVKGEETFLDPNANGQYDAGESFTDTQQEPYVDYNDSGSWDDGTGADALEMFIDTDGDSVYYLGPGLDGKNTVWDASKTLFKDIRLLITGSPTYIAVSSGGSPFNTSTDTFTIADSGSQTFSVLVADLNLNPLASYTTFSSSIVVTNAVGTLSGTTTYTLPNVFSKGPTELSFTLADSSSGNPGDPEASSIKIVVTWGDDITYTTTISGTVD